MYETELFIAVITILGGVIIALLKKRTNGDKSIEQRITAINNIKHLQNDIKEIKKDIQNLYDGDVKNHAEFDKIMGKIHEMELKFVEFMGSKRK